jgi:hypothetical protein
MCDEVEGGTVTDIPVCPSECRDFNAACTSPTFVPVTCQDAPDEKEEETCFIVPERGL